MIPLAPDDRRALAVSLALHGALLLALLQGAWGPSPKSMVIFSVETVAGMTPLGEGSGAPGASQQINNAPANSSPLAAGLRLGASDAPVTAPQPSAKVAPKSVPRAQAPSASDIKKSWESLPLGMDPKGQRGAQELSEGGMGNAREAGAAGGIPGMSGPIAGRGHTVPDFSYPKPLPEESEVIILVTVDPAGEVVSASVDRTSGYPELDQHCLAKAREIRFDPLPSGAPQLSVAGHIPFKFEFSGRARR